MKLSICMMVKNESKYLAQCLQSLQPIRDAMASELIIVDTGSEDNTVAIAQKYTDKVYFHKWNNDFSEMRNITIDYATGQWIFIIDGDEVLQESQPVIDFLNSAIDKEVGAAALTCKNVLDVDNPMGVSTLVTARIFRNDGYFHFEGVIHNQSKFKAALIEIPACFLHYGYVETDKDLMDRKFKRTSALLKGELEKDPENLYYWYQLSVSYGMHNDLDEAVYCAERAHTIFLKQQRLEENIYVLVHLAHMYQLIRDYNKVEMICLESLQIKTGYLDIYYFLAEAQAVLGKPEAAIASYQQYLAVAKQDAIIVRDIAVINYMAGNEETVYYNLSHLYKKINNYSQALYYAEQVTKQEYIKDNLQEIIFLYMKQERYADLKNYCTQVIAEANHKLFYERLEMVKREFDQNSKQAVAEVFAEGSGSYGLLSRIIIEDHQGQFSTETTRAIEQLDFSELPLYCSDIVYYLVKNKVPLHQALTHFKEVWITNLFENVAKHCDDLSVGLYEYLQKYSRCQTISEYKLSKALCRYLLLLNQLTDNDYKKIFARYVADGIFYLKLVYTEQIIENALVYEVKNDEEVFLLYMYQAQINKKVNQVQHVSYLRQALAALPVMKKGIAMLFDEIKAEIQEQENHERNEFEAYKQQVKRAIQQLLVDSKLDDAKAIINEYKIMVPHDLEILLMESELLLKAAALEPVTH